MRLTTADLVVLTVLLYERPMHGYELVKLLEKSDVKDWASISRPQVYYSLRKLAQRGFLIPAKDTAPTLGPERIVYKTAKKTKGAMQSALKEQKWIKRSPPSAFTTWCVLALQAEPEIIVAQIDRRAALLKEEISRELRTLEALGDTDSANIQVARIMIQTAMKQFRVELESLDDLRESLLGNKTPT